MKVRFLPILMLVLFVVFVIVSVSRGQRNDSPQSESAAAQPTLAPTFAPAEPEEVTVEETTEPTERTYVTVDASWFDDAAFVGDSITLKLSYYAAATGALGNAQFFASGSLGSANAMWDLDEPQAVHPSYQGQTMLTEDCVAASGANKLFIMLGMNDITIYGVEGAAENLETLIGRILDKCPGLEIYVESMTPTTSTSNLLGSQINPENVGRYNELLEQMCQTNGWNFVDVGAVMYDETGLYLRTDYCSDPEDMGVHFSEAGCLAWVEYLYTHSA